MIKTDHECLIIPTEDLQLWRYMSIEKFESMLQNKALFFCRADRFSDPFEGSLPRREVEFRDMRSTLHNIEGYIAVHHGFKRANVVNCWQINENENDAMWRLYLKSNSLAIKSSVSSITKAFSTNSTNIYLSKVRYINYDTDIWFNERDYPNRHYNFITPLVHKKIEFAHERELRLFNHIEEAVHGTDFWESKPIKYGMNLEVNIELLFDELILAPTADIEVEQEVKMIMKKYGLEKEIRQSSLSATPLY